MHEMMYCGDQDLGRSQLCSLIKRNIGFAVSVNVAEKFSIIITTRDSSRWISELLEWYKKLSVAPIFIVDSRTVDNTREIISGYGYKYFDFTPKNDFPEAGMLRFGAEKSNSDWILRLDDDELPNRSLIDWVSKIGVGSRNQCWFINRRELLVSGGEIYYSRSYGKYPMPGYPYQLHPMARLYNRSRIGFSEELHTTGLKELKLFDFSPSENFIIHLSCLVHPFSERVQKIRKYESIKPGSTWGLADEYLPEIFSPEFHNIACDGLEEFTEFLKSLKPISYEQSELSPPERQIAVADVKKRSQNILRARYAYLLSEKKSAVKASADDVAWIDKVPTFLRRPMAKFLCSMLPRKFKSIGVALWDYLEIASQDVPKAGK